MRRRALAFAAVVGCAVAVGVGFVVHAATRDDGPAPVAAAPVAVEPGRTIVFQNVARTESYARLETAALEGGRARGRTLTPLTCERVHVGGGLGLCLTPHQTAVGAGHRAILFAATDFAEIGSFDLTGINSRTRVSADGRYGVTTGFVSGHSYASDSFSTSTVLLDLRARKVIGNLESFTVRLDDEEYSSPDVNFWGVTFAPDSDRFYATLGTRSKRYLVEGTVSGREVRVLREEVECPSLSPDGTRIAFKKRVDAGWRLHVLDLDDLEDRPLSETSSVDDQAEWLDDGTILYGRSGHIWAVRADGSGRPRIFLRDALSPAVVRA